jgi:serine/threonine-protein kinase
MPGTLPPEGLSSSGHGEEPTIQVGSSAFLDELGPSSTGSEERAATLVGTLICGRYRADEIIGQGGMGAVFRGEQIHLHKRVAIKVLHPDTERLPGLVDRFEREAVAGAHVQHPNVAAAIDFGKLDDGSYFLVLEYVEGTSLGALLRAGPLAPLRALRIARQMADALVAVHDKGIVHRDIKPQNTLIGPGDQVKIIDFGLAKVDIGSATGRKPAQPSAPLTAAGVVFGTPAYLAPEAALGMGAVDARSDLYAVGVTLYEMLTGEQPFEGENLASLFRKQRLQDPPAFRARAPTISVAAEAERVTMRLLQRDPAARYQSARELVDAIDEAIRAIKRRPAASSGAGRTPRWAVVLAIGSLAAGTAAALLLRPTSASKRVTTPLSATTPPPPAPTPAPAPSAAPPTTTPAPSAAAADMDDADAASSRARLAKASQIKDWVMGSRAFLSLARLDPAILDDSDVRTQVIAMAAGIAHEGRGELADAVFDTLASRLGTAGLDLLYELALSRGGTRGGQRARALLARADVVAREPPALRVAFEFFVASCATRHALLQRAASEGDRRTLVQLEVAHSAHCANKKDPCCFREDPAMADAIAKLKARLPN